VEHVESCSGTGSGTLMVILVTLLAVAVALLGLLVAGLLRSHAEILRALHELGVELDPNAPDRERAPAGARPARSRDAGDAVDIAGEDPSGAPRHLAVAGVEHSTLLAFLSSSCLTCREFWNAFADPALSVPGGARVIAVTRGVDAESPATVRKLASPHVHTVMSTQAWHDYHVPGAPYFVLVDGPRRAVIGEGTATSWERVQALIEQATADAHEQRNIDRDLRAAGIEPGDPSLYPETG
jgi:hypothetical protein